MIWLYRLLFLPAFLLSTPYYGTRMIRRGGYAKDFSHRFGGQKNLPPPAAGKKRVWIQAVSVGEVEAIAPLVDMLSKDANFEIVITTTTSTGYKILLEKYSQKSFYTGIFPIDFWPFSSRAWDKLKPDICVLMEGEIWPEHMHQAVARGAKLVLINARMSDKSYARYLKAPFFAHRLFHKFSKVAVSSEFDMKRLSVLGMPTSRMVCTGNLKFDSSPASRLDDCAKKSLRKELGFSENSFVLLGSSTWPGEEEMLIEAMKKLREKKIDCRLLLVPRHAERREKIIPLLKEIPHNVRSRSKQAPEGTLVYLADTTGELRTLTQIADLAFIGKSLPPNVGGQTPIDCAALGVAMVYGPNMTNFRRVCQTLERENAAAKVQSAKAAIEEITRLAQSPDSRNALADSAKQWHSSNIGATEKVYNILKSMV